MSLVDIATATSGEILGGTNAMIHGICTDSRQDCSQRLFIALEGENFDGHDYIEQAITAGATAAMLSHDVDLVDTHADLSRIVVKDTLQGMATLTKSWRQLFSIPVVAITGSVGKTSLKEMIGNILSIEKAGVVTNGNFNNEIGVPLTVTRLNASHEFAVVEMGMNHFGEIARLSEMTLPTIAVINNAGAAHLENLGTIAGVAKAKGEIIAGLDEKGVLIINGDDDFADYWSELAGNRRVVRFGLNDSMDVTADYHFDATGTDLSIRYFDETFDLRIPVVGEHNVMNVLASIATAKELSINVETLQLAFDRYTPPQDRSGRYVINNSVLIDDSYNANPTSMQAAIEQLTIEQSLNSELITILVLGDMAELGEHAGELHEQIGEAAASNVDYLYVAGKYANAYKLGFGETTQVFDSKENLILSLAQDVTNLQNKKLQLRILVKGSRSAGMDEVVAALQTSMRQNENEVQK